MELTLTLILLFGLIVLVTQTLEGTTGFGSTVLALPFAVMVLGDLNKTVPILATHSWILAVYFVIVSWKHIVWKEFGFIALHVLIGLPVGYYLFKNLDDWYLKILLAWFMIGVGINGILHLPMEISGERVRLPFGKTDSHVPLSGAFNRLRYSMTRQSRRQKETPAKPVKKSLLMRFILFLGGVIHGAFASGGPFIVLYASSALRDKTLFRVTLCLLWFCLNSALMIWWTMEGRWTQDSCLALRALLATLPFLAIGIVIGDRLHHRASEYVFRLIVFALLVAGGCVVLYGVVQRSG